jgi:hypothetical protein
MIYTLTCLHVVSLGVGVERYDQALAFTLLSALHQLLGGRRLGFETELALAGSYPNIIKLLDSHP